MSQIKDKNPVDTVLLMGSTKIHTIFEGASETQQLVIARAISGLRIE